MISQYRPIFSGVIQYLLRELGVAVICPNVRGSNGYGKTYLKLDNAELREDSVRDIGALLDWIDKQPELDASRVVVSGGSYGGYMVLASLVHYGARLRGGVDVVAGVANFVLFQLPQGAPSAAEVVRRCRERKLYVRDFPEMATLGPLALRVAVKDAATNARMLAVLAEAAARA